MKKVSKNIILCVVLLTFLIPGMIKANNLITVYSDGEDGSTIGWSVTDNEPRRAVIRNVFDKERGSNVIELKGNGFDNAYGLKRSDGNYWYNTDQFILQWAMKTKSYVRIFVYVMTYQGYKYLYYDSTNLDTLGDQNYIHHSIGDNSSDGQWHTFTRNLRQDLQDAQPNNDILSVEWMVIRGDARVDDIKLMSDSLHFAPDEPRNLTISIENNKDVKLSWIDSSDEESSYQIFRDGELIAVLPMNTTTYIDDTVEAQREYVYEVFAVNDKGKSKSIQISVTTPRELIVPKDPTNLSANVNYRTVYLKWQDNSDNETAFEIYRNGQYLTEISANETKYKDEWLDLETTYEYKVYAINNDGRSKAASAVIRTGREIYTPTGPSNLSAVMERADIIKLTWRDNSNIESAYKIIRNGKILAILEPNTTQFRDVSIRDNMTYTYNVIAMNSIGDSKSATVTIKTSPSYNREEYVNESVYEDAEDMTTNKWTIYENPNNDALILNVYDEERQSRVIKLVGNEYEDGFWLKNSDGSLWNDKDHHTVEWKSKFNSAFLIYIYVKTTKGYMYLQYIPTDGDIQSGGKLNFGLGSFAKDGKWHTFKRDISEDVAKTSNYDATLISIEGFLIRGHGLLDDIKTVGE